MLIVEGPSETGLFRDLPNHIFQSSKVQKTMSYEGHPFVKYVQN